MPTPLEKIAKNIHPNKTILLFGSGATIESQAPTVQELINGISSEFSIEDNGYNLREITGIVQNSFSRRDLIEYLQKIINRAKPIGGIKNLALYDWKSIYTTNYDTVIEQCYENSAEKLTVYSSNADFSVHPNDITTKFFKLHGTIDKDISLGYSSRIVITDEDYDDDHVKEYREHLFSRLKTDLADSHLIIIGYSLNDEHIKSIINDITKTSSSTRNNQIILMMYTTDEQRAKLYENKGIKVCFGSISDFFTELSKSIPISQEQANIDDVFDFPIELNPTTIVVQEEILKVPNANKMVNGDPATYADIQAGYTFKRDLIDPIISDIVEEKTLVYTILGPSGVGKTSLARAVMLNLQELDYDCYEHKNDYNISYKDWFNFAEKCQHEDKKICLFIDDAHLNIKDLMLLVEKLTTKKVVSLKIIITSTRSKWLIRLKNTSYFRNNTNYELNFLSDSEIESLISITDKHEEIRKAINNNFDGFSLAEKKRRLKITFNSETFVCLKNIFATESFDDIILREYAQLDEEIRDIYRLVAALEYCGIRVHRQLIIRLLGIDAITVQHYLQGLADIIYEYIINEKEGVYGWKGRHPVITEILIKYKFDNREELLELIENVIDNISPTYDLEVKSLREICNFETGIPSFPDKYEQNRLYRKIISVVPLERIARHRLIRNLIDLEEYEVCDSEIKIFENDFGSRDTTVCRYKVKLKVQRGLNSKGLMDEDRIAIINQAVDDLRIFIEQNPTNKFLLKEMCLTGLILGNLTNDYFVYEHGLQLLKAAEEITQDPEITSYITSFEKKKLGNNEETNI